jgi:hypothetical protein
MTVLGICSALGKVLHLKTWLEHCTPDGGRCTLSVGQEIKLRIPA